MRHLQPRWAIILSCLLPIGLICAPQAQAKTPEELFRQAEELDKQEFFQDAVQAWKTALESGLEKKPRGVARIKLSLAYFKLGQHDAALEQARELVQSEPENYHANFNLGNILSALNRFSEAVAPLEKAVQLRPGEGLTYVGLALSHYGNGQPEKALARLQEVKEIFREKKNISWHRDTRLMIQQIQNFVQSQYPPSFSDLWLKNNLKLVRETYEKTVFNQ